MAGKGRWFSSRAAVSLTKFSPLTSGRNDGADVGENYDLGCDSQTRKTDAESLSSYDNSLDNVYTVEEAVDKLGFGVFQVLLSIFAGSIWLVEAFEVMILSILSAALKCDWDLSEFQEASITTVVFLGFMFGNPVWGVVADRFGRKRALLISLSWGFVFGLVSAFSPNYYTLLLFRGLLGFGFGGGFLGPAYCIEFLPARSRAAILCLLEIAWAIGSILEALLALVIMTSIDHEPWRWLLGISALPLLVMILMFPIAPETPRYLLFHGKEEKAKQVLALMAKVNCKPPLSGRLVTQEQKELMQSKLNQSPSSPEKLTESIFSSVDDECQQMAVGKDETVYGTLPNKEENDQLFSNVDTVVLPDTDSELLISSDKQTHRRTLSWPHIRNTVRDTIRDYYHWFLILFKNGFWKTTLLLWYLWFSAAFIYYGGTLLTTSLFQYDKHCGLSGSNDTTGECKPLSKSDYIHLVWTSCAEIPGTIWIILLLQLIGRKKAMSLTLFAAAACYGLLLLCLGKTVLTVFLFGVRGFATGFFQSIYLYTPEVYPTTVRAFGTSLCSVSSRFGSMIAPFIAQALLAHTTIVTISLFIACTALASIVSLLLPIETKGRAMKDSG